MTQPKHKTGGAQTGCKSPETSTHTGLEGGAQIVPTQEQVEAADKVWNECALIADDDENNFRLAVALASARIGGMEDVKAIVGGLMKSVPSDDGEHGWNMAIQQAYAEIRSFIHKEGK